MLILLHMFGYIEYISIASIFLKINNSAVLVLTLATKGHGSFKNIKASPKCSLFLISMIFISLSKYEFPALFIILLLSVINIGFKKLSIFIIFLLYLLFIYDKLYFPKLFFPKYFLIDSSGLFKLMHIFRLTIPLLTNIISLMKSPSCKIISPLIDSMGFIEVITFTIKSALFTSLKNIKFCIKDLYISIINLFFKE